MWLGLFKINFLSYLCSFWEQTITVFDYFFFLSVLIPTNSYYLILSSLLFSWSKVFVEKSLLLEKMLFLCIIVWIIFRSFTGWLLKYSSNFLSIIGLFDVSGWLELFIIICCDFLIRLLSCISIIWFFFNGLIEDCRYPFSRIC